MLWALILILFTSGSHLAAPSFTPVQQFEENHRLISLSSPEGREFDRYWGSLARSTFQEVDFKTRPVVFALEDSSELNAYIYRSSKMDRDVVVLSKGLIDHAPSLDALLGIIGHELAHKDLREKFQHKANSKFEEGIADPYFLGDLLQAGFDPRELAKFLDTIELLSSKNDIDTLRKIYPFRSDQELEKIRVNQQLTDTHLLHENRQAIHRGKLTQLEKNHPELEASQPRPVSQAHLERVKNISHQSRMDRYKESVDYANLDLNSKLRVLIEFLPELHPHMEARTNDLIAELKKLDLKGHEISPLVDTFADELIQMPTERGAKRATKIMKGKVYTRLAIQSGHRIGQGRPFLGRTKVLKKAIDDFVQARTKEAALSSATRLNKLLDAFPMQDAFARSFPWKGFDLPSPKKIKNIIDQEGSYSAPWSRFVPWIREGSPILIALARLGATSPEINSALFEHYDTDYFDQIEEKLIHYKIEDFFVEGNGVFTSRGRGQDFVSIQNYLNGHLRKKLDAALAGDQFLRDWFLSPRTTLPMPIGIDRVLEDPELILKINASFLWVYSKSFVKLIEILKLNARLGNESKEKVKSVLMTKELAAYDVLASHDLYTRSIRTEALGHVAADTQEEALQNSHDEYISSFGEAYSRGELEAILDSRLPVIADFALNQVFSTQAERLQYAALYSPINSQIHHTKDGSDQGDSTIPKDTLHFLPSQRPQLDTDVLIHLKNSLNSSTLSEL